MIQMFLIYHCIPLVALPKHCQLSHSRSQHLYSPNNQRKMQGRKSVDDIKAMHLAVLQKEHIKLDLEIENLRLKKQEKMLRIQESESSSNVFSCWSPAARI